MRILVTGAAGFIGFHLAMRLKADGHEVTGLDNMSPYYDVSLKKDRLKALDDKSVPVAIVDLCDKKKLEQVWRDADAQIVIHLAAQAGVRYSLDNPQAYVDSNLTGFANVLELARSHQPRTCYMRRPVPSMGPTPRCPGRRAIRSNIPCHSTLPPRRPTR